MDVTVFAPLHIRFTYQWPSLLGKPERGIRIRVPFGAGERIAVVQRIFQQPYSSDVKQVLDRLDLVPLFSQKRERFLKRLGRYYLATEGQVWDMALAWAAHEKRRFRCLDKTQLQSFDVDLAQAFKTKAALAFKTICDRCLQPYAHYRLLQALDAGLLHESIQASTPIEWGDEKIPTQLRKEQLNAYEKIMDAGHNFQSFLLFGVTGSGKTEVYLKLAEAKVKEGKQVLILVPEIGLTPMWMSRLAQRFKHIGTWHSGMSNVERIALRHHINDVDVLIGTRSALFLPLPRLSMIVVDEEHDTSFKQQDGVAYSARDMSLLLAQEENIPVILGSATPSLESWRQVHTGDMQLLALPTRISKHQAIIPEVIDMRGSQAVLSEAFLNALKQTKEAGQQSIVFLNRRGYAPALQCTACGTVDECKSCSIRLTLHRKAGELRCHSCGFSRRVPRVCNTCGEDALLPLGAGTEKIEEILTQALPALSFARFDRDVVQSQKQLQQTLQAFAQGELDCLVGTQMLVKGHHFPNVTLVGVVNADLGLNLPDFRAGERWWQQMTQVVGRAGRGDVAGRVLIQTCNPDASWLSRLSESTASDVLNEEQSLREMLSFPPFSRWVRVVFSSQKLNKAEQAADAMAELLHAWGKVQISGPMLCALERVSGRFRVELLLRDSTRKLLPWYLEPMLKSCKLPSGVRRRVDVDPQDMM